jgi:methylphosphotriester-DNA--protein-cysteine methyltransferase
VTRSDGSIGQYIFGPATKRALLEQEGVDLAALEALTRAGVQFVGTDTTGIFCLPTCSQARRITAAHRSTFHNAAAAVAAGYRPCLRCRPAAAAA